MKIGTVLRDLHRDENDLARALVQLSEKHRADHEVHYLARDLAAWSERHVREIARVATAYGQQLEPAPDDNPTVADRARLWASGLTARTSDMELVMVRDLRDVFLRASSVLADWEMIGQAAQAIRHEKLLELATSSQKETGRQVKWANAKIKESSTQALVV